MKKQRWRLIVGFAGAALVSIALAPSRALAQAVPPPSDIVVEYFDTGYLSTKVDDPTAAQFHGRSVPLNIALVPDGFDPNVMAHVPPSGTIDRPPPVAATPAVPAQNMGTFLSGDLPEDVRYFLVEYWLDELYRKSNSGSGYFLGKPTAETFAGFVADRYIIIVPSEVFRDGEADWDRFEIVFSWGPEDDHYSVLLSTENYSRRDRGGVSLGGSSPSPDWQYDRVTDSTTTNGRLKAIADAIMMQVKTPIDYAKVSVK